jgi:hypothetical protein
MEKMFSKSEVETLLNKALLDGKIKALNYFLGYVDTLLTPVQEQTDYIIENGWTQSENFIRLDGELSTLLKIKREIEKTINKMEIKK